jgi:thioredoxin 2
MNETLLFRCPRCSATNRIPLEKIHQQPNCGKCKNPLPVDQPMIVTDTTFASDVGQSTLPVLLDLWADWCGPCRFIAPVVNELARELAGKVRVAKINIDENPVTPARYGVLHIPTLLIIKNGEEVDRIVGVQPKKEIERHLQRFISTEVEH